MKNVISLRHLNVKAQGMDTHLSRDELLGLNKLITKGLDGAGVEYKLTFSDLFKSISLWTKCGGWDFVGLINITPEEAVRLDKDELLKIRENLDQLIGYIGDSGEVL